MSVPRATLRLQFHHGFTFGDARSLAPYFASLGVSDIYASPIMTARRGSMHGYDVVDPTRINPEIGGEHEFRRFVGDLRRHGLGLIVDVVPNHMAIGAQNAWWMDVLAHGQASRYAGYFDIDWDPPNRELTGKVLLPVLRRPYGEVLAAGEIGLEHDSARGAFIIRYFEHVFPVAENRFGETAPSDFDPARPRGRERLHDLLERQHYRLVWWHTANDEINWRRFFDINELAAIRIEDDAVFEDVHGTLFRLYRDGLIDGVRVDHIDGLAQPERYCRQLRERLRALEAARPVTVPDGRAYVVVENILARGESLPAGWQTDGTTGYDFMDEISAVLHDKTGERPLRALWRNVSGNPRDFDGEEELARRQILERSFAAQRQALVESLHVLAQASLATRDYSREAIRRCLTEILAHFQVYRIYARVDDASTADCAFLSFAIVRAAQTCLPADRPILATLHEWLSGKRIHPSLDTLQNIALERFEQLSAPLCAKAVEDTAFYRYGRSLSRNDVGFDARTFACSIEEFHHTMVVRSAEFPHAMLATATHDHKRGEDVRARLAVLSEVPEEWTEAVERWLEMSAPHRRADGAARMPDNGDLAMLFQTIVGAWPLRLSAADQDGLRAFCDRIIAWQRKALREAKLRSDWTAPNETYERAARDYVGWLFSDQSNLLLEIEAFVQRIAPAGAAKGLAQVLVKLTAPGIADIYQGTEYWDFSLVDPDNRLPVDFASRRKSLDRAHFDELLANWDDGRLKQFLIAHVLAVRREIPHLFAEGKYLPLETSGHLAAHFLGFARVLPKDAAITVFCRLPVKLLSGQRAGALCISNYQGTRIHIPPELQGSFSDALLPERTVSVGSSAPIGQLLNGLPVAFLTRCSK